MYDRHPVISECTHVENSGKYYLFTLLITDQNSFVILYRTHSKVVRINQPTDKQLQPTVRQLGIIVFGAIILINVFAIYAMPLFS